MFEAQLLINSSETAVFSPWQPRGGDNAIWVVDVVDFSLTGRGEFRAQVYHKNSEETGSGTGASSQIWFTAAGRKEIEVSGLEELVRIRFSFSDEASADDWVLVRALTPVFFDAVKG